MKPWACPPPAGPAVEIRRVSVVIPVFNSERTLGGVVDRCLEALAPRFGGVEIVLVNDGSRDGSHAVALEAVKRHPGRVRYARLARNFGEHNAVMCGLRHATGDAVAIVDDDFQNPPEEILRLCERLREGYDVVYSTYETKHHGPLRNLGSAFNDWVATRLLGKPRGLYLSSFKVLNAFLVREITPYGGPFPYVDGLILRSTSNIGTETCRHAPRSAGRSNYDLGRLVRLWLNMFTGFSVVPLRLASLLGLAMATAGFLLALFFALSWMLGGVFSQHGIPPGWASLIVSLTFFAGIQLCVLGMLGEYLGRVFLTQNQAPQFVVRETHGFQPPGRGDA